MTLTQVREVISDYDVPNRPWRFRRPFWRPWRRLHLDVVGRPRYTIGGQAPDLSLDDMIATDWEVV